VVVVSSRCLVASTLFSRRVSSCFVAFVGLCLRFVSLCVCMFVTKV
jgi:hypothetical protein